MCTTCCLVNSYIFDGFFFFKQKTAYEMRISDWSSDVCSSDLFPLDRKAAPLLRGWVRRLRDAGVRFHVHHRWLGWDDAGALRFETPEGERRVETDAVVLALGGGSWPQLGSDGAWQNLLRTRGIHVAALLPANCGFDLVWSQFMHRSYDNTSDLPA